MVADDRQTFLSFCPRNEEREVERAQSTDQSLIVKQLSLSGYNPSHFSVCVPEQWLSLQPAITGTVVCPGFPSTRALICSVFTIPYFHSTFYIENKSSGQGTEISKEHEVWKKDKNPHKIYP